MRELLDSVILLGGRARNHYTNTNQRLQFDYRDMRHPLDSAHAVGATVFLRQKLTDAWGLILVAAPGYADDFEGTITDRLWLKSILPISAELTWLPHRAVGLRASLLVNGGNFHGAESVYRVNNPQLNYSAAMADLGVRWFMLPWLHVTIHGGHTVFRRFEFSQGREPVPGAEYEPGNGLVYAVDLGVGG